MYNKTAKTPSKSNRNTNLTDISHVRYNERSCNFPVLLNEGEIVFCKK